MDTSIPETKVWYMLDGGYMKASCQNWARLRRDLLSADRYSSVANQVGVGWNMISYTDTGLYFQFRASKNFQSFSSSQTIEFGYTEGFTGILGGYRSGNLFT